MARTDWSPGSNSDAHHQGQDDRLPCARCPCTCDGIDGLHDHYSTSHSAVYCAPCRRLFTAPHNLKAHLRRSGAHTVPDIACLTGCGRTFCEASAMWKHIERAGCANAIATLSGFLERLVASDTQNLIIKPGVRPEDIRTVRRMVGDDMYDAARGAWTCLMCNMANPHRGYLQAHLDGGVHDRKVFQCPDWRCGHDASTFSNLMLHVETRKCRGYKIADRKSVV